MKMEESDANKWDEINLANLAYKLIKMKEVVHFICNKDK